MVGDIRVYFKKIPHDTGGFISKFVNLNKDLMFDEPVDESATIGFVEFDVFDGLGSAYEASDHDLISYGGARSRFVNVEIF